jgi:hypothetical protein
MLLSCHFTNEMGAKECDRCVTSSSSSLKEITLLCWEAEYFFGSVDDGYSRVPVSSHYIHLNAGKQLWVYKSIQMRLTLV